MSSEPPLKKQKIFLLAHAMLTLMHFIAYGAKNQYLVVTKV